MSVFFSGNEIADIGIQIEKNGREFYLNIARKLKSKEVADVFVFLAKEEEGHIDAFEKLKSFVEEESPMAESYSGEYVEYVKGLADTAVFAKKDKGEEIAKKVKSDIEAIDIAIGFEKDSILFFQGIENIISKRAKEVISKLISEEQEHFRKLNEIKKKLLN